MHPTAANMNSSSIAIVKEFDRRSAIVTKGKEECIFAAFNPSPWLAPSILHICSKHVTCIWFDDYKGWLIHDKSRGVTPGEFDRAVKGVGLCPEWQIELLEV